MANATVSRLGQVNASGDANALFLKVVIIHQEMKSQEVRLSTLRKQSQ